jgi:hypothetical protein
MRQLTHRLQQQQKQQAVRISFKEFAKGKGIPVRLCKEWRDLFSPIEFD